MPTRLTANVKAGGCASKLSPKILDAALKRLPRQTDDRVLVGFDTADDAGVYDLSAIAGSPLAMVQTVDFFTPIVDDPYTFGAIAAANALSDIYAMGGRPVSALSLLVYPEKGEMDDLHQMLRGGAEKMIEAECAVIGGHSITDDQIKFGYSVTGLIDPRRIWKNSGAQPGDALVFTKKLGTGVISTALKRNNVAPEDMEASIEQMLTLNRGAAESMAALSIHACTDVTGFSLLGHAREMALASGVTVELHAGSVQFLPGAIAYSQAGAHSNGLKNNREFASSCVEMPGEMPPEIEALLYDPQTSGGLLASLPEADARTLIASRPEAYWIGRVTARSRKPVEVIA